MPGMLNKVTRVHKRVGIGGVSAMISRKLNPKRAIIQRQKRREANVKKLLGFVPKNLGHPTTRALISITRRIKEITIEKDQSFRRISAHLKGKELRDAKEALERMANRKRDKQQLDVFIDGFLKEKNSSRSRREQIQRVLRGYLQMDAELKKLHEERAKLE